MVLCCSVRWVVRKGNVWETRLFFYSKWEGRKVDANADFFLALLKQRLMVLFALLPAVCVFAHCGIEGRANDIMGSRWEVMCIL